MDLWEFKTSLVYRASSKVAKSTHGNPISTPPKSGVEGHLVNVAMLEKGKKRSKDILKSMFSILKCG